MYIDSYQLIVMEQSGFPGGWGDSAAESSRYVILATINGEKVNINLKQLVTETGVLRHPLSPWRENDTSSDQVVPLLAATSLLQPELASVIIKQIKTAGYKTGNGDLISTGLLENMRRAEKKHFLWISDLAILGQALIFQLPFRWSDSKRFFELSSGSSSDYLNFTTDLAFAKITNTETIPIKLAKLLIVSKEKILSEVNSYYAAEPNHSMIIEEYTKALERIY